MPIADIKKKILTYLKEANRHKKFIEKEIPRIEEILSKLNFENEDHIILTDAFIFRYVKLQNVLNEKIFPLLFEYLTGKDKSEYTFLDILNDMERYKIIPDVDFWKETREIRNILVHDYPEEEKVKRQAIIKAIKIVNKIYKVIKNIEKITGKENDKK